MKRRRVGFVSFLLLGVGLGTYAVASSDFGEAPEAQSPIAVVPAAEEPSPNYLRMQRNAIPVPSGAVRDGRYKVAPAIVSPSR
ncbi:MAG: hypothetical protein V2A76_18850 [Planctomycetota bacterium]